MASASDLIRVIDLVLAAQSHQQQALASMTDAELGVQRLGYRTQLMEAAALLDASEMGSKRQQPLNADEIAAVTAMLDGLLSTEVRTKRHAGREEVARRRCERNATAARDAGRTDLEAEALARAQTHARAVAELRADALATGELVEEVSELIRLVAPEVSDAIRVRRQELLREDNEDSRRAGRSSSPFHPRNSSAEELGSRAMVEDAIRKLFPDRSGDQ